MRRSLKQHWALRARWRRGLLCFLTGLAVSSCGWRRSRSRSRAQWQIVASDLPEAVLSIAGLSDHDVWAVGADANLGRGPLVLHYDGTAWTRVDHRQPGHALVDPVVLRRHGDDGGRAIDDPRRPPTAPTFQRQRTPGLANATVFGLWGATASDVYAVGSIAGRDGFIWHFDGAAWSEVDLPDGLPQTALGDWPGFFKVWGDGAGHVYVAGGRGVLLRRDGAGPFAIVPTGAGDTTLFTVHGTALGAVVAVGGGGNGAILEVPVGGAVKDVTPAGAPLIQGVAVDADGHGFATGAMGAIFERTVGSPGAPSTPSWRCRRSNRCTRSGSIPRAASGPWAATW